MQALQKHKAAQDAAPSRRVQGGGHRPTNRAPAAVSLRESRHVGPQHASSGVAARYAGESSNALITKSLLRPAAAPPGACRPGSAPNLARAAGLVSWVGAWRVLAPRRARQGGSHPLASWQHVVLALAS
jgi:hypothetical protein